MTPTFVVIVLYVLFKADNHNVHLSNVFFCFPLYGKEKMMYNNGIMGQEVLTHALHEMRDKN